MNGGSSGRATIGRVEADGAGGVAVNRGVEADIASAVTGNRGVELDIACGRPGNLSTRTGWTRRAARNTDIMIVERQARQIIERSKLSNGARLQIIARHDLEADERQ